MKRVGIEEYVAVTMLGAVMFFIGHQTAREAELVKMKSACINPPHLISIEHQIYFCKDYKKIKQREYGK